MPPPPRRGVLASLLALLVVLATTTTLAPSAVDAAGLLSEQCASTPPSIVDRRKDGKEESLVVASLHVGPPFEDAADANAARPRSHVQAVGRYIAALEADVLVLTGVESCAVLRQFIAAAVATNAEAASALRPYILPRADADADDGGTRHAIAVLSKIDPRVDVWRDYARVDAPLPRSTCHGDVDAIASRGRPGRGLLLGAPPTERDLGAFYTLVPIRPRQRCEHRSLRTLPGASLRPPPAFNPRPRRLLTPTDAYELHPDIASYGMVLSRRRRRRRGGSQE